ncbi:hypothetical protein GCM10009628_32970 [Paeniglutamicibacter kerguelensis]
MLHHKRLDDLMDLQAHEPGCFDQAAGLLAGNHVNVQPAAAGIALHAFQAVGRQLILHL